jgi:hypothetical protein
VDIPDNIETVTDEDYTQVKKFIEQKHILGRKIRNNQATLSDVQEYTNLGEFLNLNKQEIGKRIPETSDDIDEIVDNPAQLLMYAKEIGLKPTLPVLNAKKRVKNYLHNILNSQEQEKTLGINEMLSDGETTHVGQNQVIEIDGKKYQIANRPTSTTETISEQQKTQVVLNELGREIAKRIFNGTFSLNEGSLQALMNKVLSDTYPDYGISINQETIKLIAANISALQQNLKEQEYNFIFNDKIISSVFKDVFPNEEATVGIASQIPLMVVDAKGNINLINFKLFTGNTSDNLGIFDNEMTTLQSLFLDNDIKIEGIHTLPIRVEKTIENVNGKPVIVINKTNLDFRNNSENPISPQLIELQTNFAAQDDFFKQTGKPEQKEDVEEDVVVNEKTPEQIKQELQEGVEEKTDLESVVTSTEIVEPIPTGPVYFVGGTVKGTYVKVKQDSRTGKYKIEVKNNPSLNDYYKTKSFATLDAVRDEYAKVADYEVNAVPVKKIAWRAPKEFILNKFYSLQDEEGNRIISPVHLEYTNNGGGDDINNINFIGTAKGTEVEIVEGDESLNNSESVQKNFAQNANLIITMNGKPIGIVAPGSPLRAQLSTTMADGKNRLSPTFATIQNVKRGDFDTQAPITILDWLVEFQKANGPYRQIKIGYIKQENDNFVLKDVEGKTIEVLSEDSNPVLGATYLILTDVNGIKTKFALQTPKLKNITLSDGTKVTETDLEEIFSQIPASTLNNKEGLTLYNAYVQGINRVKDTTKNPKTREIIDYIATELGSLTNEARAIFTSEQIQKIQDLGVYNAENKNEIEKTISDFFLDRLITLNINTAYQHLITAKPTVVFLDNTIEVTNVRNGSQITDIKGEKNPIIDGEEEFKFQNLTDDAFLDLLSSNGLVEINPDCL